MESLQLNNWYPECQDPGIEKEHLVKIEEIQIKCCL